MKVLITGATSGIGEALIAEYVELNHDVIACGRNPEKLATLQGRFSAIETLCFDITERADVEAAISEIDALDLAILNAGDCEYIDDVYRFDAALFERVIRVNLIAMGYLVSAIIPKLLAPTHPKHTSNNKCPQLAIMSSSVTYLPFPRAQAYGASKAGVDYLAAALALELKDEIDISVIKPGFIKTPLTDKNDFAMPFLMSAQQAAQRISAGLAKRKSVIEFPKRLVYLLKFISFLPDVIWQALNKNKGDDKLRQQDTQSKEVNK